MSQCKHCKGYGRLVENDEAVPCICVENKPMKQLSEKTINALIKAAQRSVWSDNFGDSCVYDFCGGNFDDAYYGGVDDGETHLARDILAELDVEYEIEDKDDN